MASFYPISTTKILILREQLNEIQNYYRQNHQGTDYKGRNDFPKYLYENGLVNLADKKCSKTLEQIKKENIPNGTPDSQIDLKYPNERFDDGGRSRDSSTGLFR